jgi:hypothetical protein
MAGNRLGARRLYKYVSDTGEEYRVFTDESLGTAVGAELNDELPDKPTLLRPRVVYAQATDGVRRTLIIPETDNDLYNSDNSQEVTIDGETFKTTGRRGESFTFRSNPANGNGGGGDDGGGIIIPG